MGKKLISGSGEGNSAISYWAISNVIMAIVFGVLFCSVFPNYFRSLARGSFANRGALNMYTNMVFTVGVFFIVLHITFAVLMSKAVAKTEIGVYENGIAGTGVGKGFIWGDVRLLSFQLAYNQITSVELTNTAVIIHAANAQYKCYVANGAEIQNTIFNQRNLPVSSSNNGGTE